MLQSLITILTTSALFYMLIGVVLGLIFGAIPGLTATLAVVLLIPITYTMDATAGMATLIGAYVGGISGGFVSAIMLNMPGTPASVATCFDGFPLAQQGKAGKALGVGIASSLVGSVIGWLCLIVLAPVLSNIALSFGAFEYCAALLFGFTAVITLGGKSPIKGLICALLGLTLSLVGYDAIGGMSRATYGTAFLMGGIAYMPALIGLFVVSEIFSQIENIHERYVVPKQEIKDIFMSRKELKESFPNFIRSSLIGVAIGILPGIGGTFANFVCYDQAKKASKDPDSFGKGNIQGVVAAEAGNKGTIGGALIPFVSLGIPGDMVTAALLGGLMIKGITPGPLFATEQPETLYAIYNSVLVASLLVGAIMLLVGIRVFPLALRIPKHILLPVVLIMALVGTYNMNFSVNEVWIAVVMGVIGFLMGKLQMPKTPMIITMILGRSFEVYFRTAMTYSGGSFVPFLTRPYALLFVVITIVTIAAPCIQKLRKAKKAAA